jgi:hypothetical protein
MATNGKKSSTNESQNSGESAGTFRIRWANVYLESSMKEAAKLLGKDADKLESMIHTLLSDGYTLSHSFNEKTDSFITTIIGKRVDNANQGWAMTTHAGSWYDSLCRALYKHFVLGEQFTYEEMNDRFGNNQP